MAVYGLMSISVVGLVAALVLVMLGYQFNRNDGKIEQGGLVQFDTMPGGANVTIDGANFGTQTPSKTTLSSGSHFVTMNRSGYKTWQKPIDVVAGSVLWLNYARLIPNDLTPKNVADFATVTSSVSSPDDKWMALKDDPTTPTILLTNLGQQEIKVATLMLPEASYTKPAKAKNQSFTLVAFDPDSRYVLVKHTYDKSKSEWLVVDTQNPSATKNITTLLDVDTETVVFSNDNSRILYVLINDDVRKLDIDSATLSRPLVRDVAEFGLYDRSTITYVTKPDEKTKLRSVGYYTDGAAKSRTIKTYPADAKVSLRLAIGKYFNDAYVAIAHGDTLEIFEGDLPYSDNEGTSALDTVASLTIPGGADYLSIKTNGRFIVAQHGATFTVYDLELKKMTTTKLKDGAVAGELSWLDGYTVLGDQGGMLRLYEFDGANQQEIMPVVSGQSVTLSPSDKYIYGITKEKNAYHLTRAQLILDN